MTTKDFGILSLQTSIGAWVVGVLFTLLSWWSMGIVYSDYQSGEPKPESLLLEILPLIAFLAFPASAIATILGFVAIFRAQSRVKAIFGIVTSLPLFLFIGIVFWVAVNGGI